MFLTSFISATLFPMGSEAVLVLNLTNGLNIYYLLLIATFGNSLGSYLNYWFGVKGENHLVDKKILNEKKIL